MRRNILVLFLCFISFILGGLAVYIYFEYIRQDKEYKEEETIISDKKELDEDKVKTHLSKVDGAKGVYWQRAMDLFWNDIENSEGEYDWSMVDERLEEFHELEVYPLVIIKPFANWDQDKCHGEEYIAQYDQKKGGEVKVGKPCSMDDYRIFLKKAVERYDGDGINDMPDLEIPIKYWEIMNEPCMQGGQTGGMGEELKFFVGSSEDYLEILKASYEVIKETDPEAYVVQGGQAGMQDQFTRFWNPIFKNSGCNYFDIANIHSISTDEDREDLYVIKFKYFLKEYNCESKPIWVTELQIGALAEKPENLENFETLLVKSTVFSLSKGADKLFYIDNWMFWDNVKGQRDENIDELLDSSTHKVYLNLIDKLNNFETIEILNEDFEEYEDDNRGAHSNIGQYKFINDSKFVYILWGRESIPSELVGDVIVTDIYGESKVMNISEIVLDDRPVFIELI